MKLFIVPSWYPSPLHPEDGTFYRDQARLLARSGIQVTVISSNIRSLKDWSSRKKLDNPIGPVEVAGVLEYRREAINVAPGLPRLFFRTYRRNLQILFWKALKDQGSPDWVWIHS
ncbi:MAG: glycosyltransferase family 4 protein, partial [FCB group bacterium]|nr:glycosyltransferase family 4 protein [FCB group bacterium]